MNTNVRPPSSTPFADQAVEFGKVKWFGGLNNKTGRTNEYGFLEVGGSDLYFHKSDILSAPTAYIPDTEVVFLRTEGRKGAAAVAVKVLSLMADEELVALVSGSPQLGLLEILKLINLRPVLAPLQAQALRAIRTLADDGAATSLIQTFWQKFPPTSIDDELVSFAPTALKRRLYQAHFADFRKQLKSLFAPLAQIKTTLGINEVYGSNLDERDKAIAQQWAPLKDNEASLAKMLSARAAEKAAMVFYRGMGSEVEDVAITQLDGKNADWKTHDLLVDSTIAVDVKNARRPINSKGFYAEHTVAKFKLDRQDQHVKIAGVLSPYLKLEVINDPSTLMAVIDGVVFLGETARNSIDQLERMFATPRFEVMRPGATVPNWLFSYPSVWYSQFVQALEQFTVNCTWPEGEQWRYALTDDEIKACIPAFCLVGKALPERISLDLEGWQLRFYLRMQQLAGGRVPELPQIFFAVLTDFLTQLQHQDPRYSPQGYIPLLYGANGKYPLGAIDPLGLVKNLIDSLGSIWQCRADIDLGSLTNFRFGGLGVLQGRAKHQWKWTPLIVYCGGNAYGKDAAGNVRVDQHGKPLVNNGKCGKFPLVIGQSNSCAACGRLVCTDCGFCTAECQNKHFIELAEAQRKLTEMRKAEMAARIGNAPQWEIPPIEAYERFYDGRG